MQNRAQFNTIKTASNLLKGFTPGNKELAALRSFAATNDSLKLADFSAVEASQIQQRLQILMARQIWRVEGYFEVSNQFDLAVKKAITVVQ